MQTFALRHDLVQLLAGVLHLGNIEFPEESNDEAAGDVSQVDDPELNASAAFLQVLPFEY